MGSVIAQQFRFTGLYVIASWTLASGGCAVNANTSTVSTAFGLLFDIALMEILFPILLGLIVAAVLVFLVVAIRSFLGPNRKRQSENDRDTFAGSESTGWSSGEYGNAGGTDTDAMDRQAFGGGGEFEGGGSGGTFDTDAGEQGLDDAGVGVTDNDSGGNSGGGDGGGDSGDGGGGNGGSGE